MTILDGFSQKSSRSFMTRGALHEPIDEDIGINGNYQDDNISSRSSERSPSRSILPLR